VIPSINDCDESAGVHMEVASAHSLVLVPASVLTYGSGESIKRKDSSRDKEVEAKVVVPLAPL
jgi:hypothetical protein